MENTSSHEVPIVPGEMQKILSVPTPPDRSSEHSDWPSAAQMESNAVIQGMEHEAGKTAFQERQEERRVDEKEHVAAIVDSADVGVIPVGAEEEDEDEEELLIALNGADDESGAENAAA